MSSAWKLVPVRMSEELRGRLRVVGATEEWSSAGGMSGFVRAAVEEKLVREHAGLFDSTEPVGVEAAGSVGSDAPADNGAAAGTRPVDLATWIRGRLGGALAKGAINFAILSGRVTVGGVVHKKLEALPAELARGVEIDGEVV